MSSDTNQLRVEYPHDWLQPVVYDHSAYRRFVGSIDHQLAGLEQKHASRGHGAQRKAILPTHQQPCGTAQDEASDSSDC
ncbi:hypothetical protein [Aeoliella mucimassa]|uniref:Uncharacterized protein n=1 Tax=Aeoliella mucimassa TaxID=2527972 RepID=A0A518AMM9_9BACT|nr:hypothetical protein [Aeoliella mucimassa]QDU55980.1 hypothetical protein Pan181_21820 [Aeoliella mucimassa]